jgi:hypothetical protein
MMVQLKAEAIFNHGLKARGRLCNKKRHSSRLFSIILRLNLYRKTFAATACTACVRVVEIEAFAVKPV